MISEEAQLDLLPPSARAGQAGFQAARPAGGQP